MATYPRRGVFPDDAESAYQRWREAELTALPRGSAAEEALVTLSWMAGWHIRGQVMYGSPDEPPDPPTRP